MENNPLVSIIIINWNGISFLKKCIPSLVKQKYKNLDIVLVDNASTDGSISYVKTKFPQIKIVINKENLGFAEANNIGYAKTKGEYVLFLNNDTEVTQEFLTHLISIFQKDKEKEIGGAQSKILLLDKPSTLDSVGSYLTNTGFLYHYGVAKRDSKKYNKQIPIFSAKGACMLFRRDVLEKIMVDGEIFDSRYFAYFEETDMCHRVWLAGYKIIYAPESIIYHKSGGTSTKMNNEFIQFHSFKNRINSYIKNFGTVKLMSILPLHILICEAYAVFAAIRLNYKIFLAIQKSIWWNIINLTKTLEMRSHIQTHIRKQDDTLFEKFVMRNVRISYYYYMLSDLGRYED